MTLDIISSDPAQTLRAVVAALDTRRHQLERRGLVMRGAASVEHTLGFVLDALSEALDRAEDAARQKDRELERALVVRSELAADLAAYRDALSAALSAIHALSQHGAGGDALAELLTGYAPHARCELVYLSPGAPVSSGTWAIVRRADAR